MQKKIEVNVVKEKNTARQSDEQPKDKYVSWQDIPIKDLPDDFIKAGGLFTWRDCLERFVFQIGVSLLTCAVIVIIYCCVFIWF